MDDDTRARLIGLEIDALMIRVENLPAHPDYTKAGEALARARDRMTAGVNDLHQKRLSERYGGR